MTKDKKVLCFIGGGNMASAIISGISKEEWRITVVEVMEEQRKKLESLFNVETYSDTSQIINEADVIVFAVKPQILDEVLKPLSSVNLSNRVIISIMAGIPLSALQSKLKGDGIKFVRTMPNTPLFVNCGVTGVYSTDSGTNDIVKSIFGGTGKVFFFNEEEDLNKVTAISGSGPAYFFLFIEAISKAGQEMGLSKEISDEMAIYTALGASKLAAESKDDVSVLRANVTSKKGTTDKAITTFQSQNFETIVRNAVFAALERARELAIEYEEQNSKL